MSRSGSGAGTARAIPPGVRRGRVATVDGDSWGFDGFMDSCAFKDLLTMGELELWFSATAFPVGKKVERESSDRAATMAPTGTVVT